MAGGSAEEDQRKRAIFEAMSPRRRERILARGYDRWDPFVTPKDPLDIRMNRRRERALDLMQGFLRAVPDAEGSAAYRQGAWEICLGVVNEEDRWRGVYDFACWYRDRGKKNER